MATPYQNQSEALKQAYAALIAAADMSQDGDDPEDFDLFDSAAKALAQAFDLTPAETNQSPAVRCDQCAACMIQGVFCHETGCPNANSRYEDGEWIKQRKCFACGCTVDADDLCCDAQDVCAECGLLSSACDCEQEFEDAEEHEDTDSLEDRGLTLGSYGS